MNDERLGLTLEPDTVTAVRPHVEAAGDAFGRLGDALQAERDDPTPENRAAVRSAHDDLLAAQRGFDRALAGQGYRTDRASSYVVLNVLQSLRSDHDVSERAARAVRVRLIDSPPFAEDRLPLPDDLAPAWSRSVGVIPA